MPCLTVSLYGFLSNNVSTKCPVVYRSCLIMYLYVALLLCVSASVCPNRSCLIVYLYVALLLCVSASVCSNRSCLIMYLYVALLLCVSASVCSNRSCLIVYLYVALLLCVSASVCSNRSCLIVYLYVALLLCVSASVCSIEIRPGGRGGHDESCADLAQRRAAGRTRTPREYGTRHWNLTTAYHHRLCTHSLFVPPPFSIITYSGIFSTQPRAVTSKPATRSSHPVYLHSVYSFSFKMHGGIFSIPFSLRSRPPPPPAPQPNHSLIPKRFSIV